MASITEAGVRYAIGRILGDTGTLKEIAFGDKGIAFSAEDVLEDDDGASASVVRLDCRMPPLSRFFAKEDVVRAIHKALDEAMVEAIDGRLKPAPVAIHVGTMRLHFNRHGAAPLVWSVDAIGEDGAVLWELAVAGISCMVPVGSRYVPKATPDDEDGKPSAWFEVQGTLTIVNAGGFSCARITP